MAVNVLLALASVAAAVRASVMLGLGGTLPGAWWAVLVSASVEFAALVAATVWRMM